MREPKLTAAQRANERNRQQQMQTNQIHAAQKEVAESYARQAEADRADIAQERADAAQDAAEDQADESAETTPGDAQPV